MEIPVNATVRFEDGRRGASTHVVINLQDQRVTHLVVETKGIRHGGCLVPIAVVADSSLNLIRLRYTVKDLRRMMPFTRLEWTSSAPGCYIPPLEQYLMHKSAIRPYRRPVKGKLVPLGHLALGRRTRAQTTNGHIGRVEKLIIYPTDGRIIRLAIRMGRFWNQKTLTVPFWRIARIGPEIPIAETPSTVPISL